MSTFVYDTSAKVTPKVTPKEPEFPPFKLSKTYENLETEDFDFSDESVIPSVLASRLIETAKLYNSYSCTANQVGLKSNVFVAGAGEEFVAFFNLKIHFDEMSVDDTVLDVLDTEIDTISHPGLQIKIPRYSKVFVSYQDYTGTFKTAEFHGLTARIIQQCYERLNGISFTKKVSPLKLERAKKVLDKKLKAIVRADMVKIRVRK